LYGDVRGQRKLDTWEERLQYNTLTHVTVQAAFRLDFPDFLRSLSRRDRWIARFLSLGHSAKNAAEQFRHSPRRITLLRQGWRREWIRSQGEHLPEDAAFQ
jgi:hypothetical protein